MDASADSSPEAQAQAQETSMPPPSSQEEPIQVVPVAEDDPSAQNTEAKEPLSPAKKPACLKKTFAKIQYQFELNIDPPEQDAMVKQDIMQYIADNLKMEYKFNGKPFFVFSPMNVTDPDQGCSFRKEKAKPISFSVEAIKTTENWDYGRYETNMTIQLKKRRQSLAVLQDDPHDGEVDTLKIEKKLGRDHHNFGELIEESKFKLLAFGTVLALLVGLAVTLISPMGLE